MSINTLRPSAGGHGRYILVVGFLLLCVLGGGAARPDVLSLLYLRPLGIICLVWLLVSRGKLELGQFRFLFILLGLFAVTMIIQLIPLPPGLWLGLPGHDRFSEAAVAGGFGQPWRPISLTPDLTLNALLALLPSLVILVGAAAMREDQRHALLPILICLVFADAVWAAGQYASGGDNWMYLYKITNSYSPVGFFSNRNHHALFLALGFPMLGAWIGMPARSRQHYRTRFWLAVAGGLFLIPMILVTGSRAGAILGGIGLVFAYLISPPPPISLPRRGRQLLRIGACLLPIVLIIITIYADRAVSLDRIEAANSGGGEVRLEALPVLLSMVRDFLPTGIGFGAFDPAYKVFEPDSSLSPLYLNHAHNDLVELALTGGIAALLVFALFLFASLKRGIPLLARGAGSSQEGKFARLGGILILLILGASVVDYPLRVPFMSAVFTIACVWLLGRPKVAAKAAAEPDPASPVRGRRLRSGSRILIVAAGIGLMWPTLGVTTSLVLGKAHPEWVLPWWSIDSDTRAAAAAQMVEGRARPAALARAYALAQDSLQREPVNMVAARTLALVSALRGDQPKAERLARYAETLSRRDLGIQFWLIESSVRSNDIQGALLHYDRALRTSPGSAEVLYPVLVQASADPGVRGPLANLLLRRPPWWADFAAALIARGSSPVSIEYIVRTLRLDLRNDSERALLAAAVNRLVEAGNPGLGFDLYRRSVGGAGPVPLPVRNGNFEAESPLPPIDWALSDDEDLRAIIQPRQSAAGGQAMFLVARNGRSGEVAHQLLMLAPGNYRLSALAGTIAGASTDRPQMTLSCAQPSQMLFDFRLPASPDTGIGVTQDFTVPSAACSFQWLRINASSGRDSDAPHSWIDDIAIRPTR